MSTPKSALRIFYILGSIIAALNIHFVVYIHLFDYDVPLIDQNTTNAAIDHPFAPKAMTIFIGNEPSQKIRFCYSQLNSTYFEYITELFPW